ncbi:hypothetical protein ACFO1B_49810 [Dactylosporangium siamense]|uniref:DUF3558 domain-containing protein n=1 Tax=Dactylosporangium siamense TaxID=685454 RepID=A0A919UEI3_9ACTN|nr:hypothetical protein [Dactylosporangium siamense]GIG52479.1 hypothetical protein Dsi01nite_105200 [Dactylosporangium siamense]
MPGRSAAIAALALILLAGCARPTEAGGPGPAASTDLHDAWTSCAKELADPRPGPQPVELPRLPGDFAPVEVVVCAWEIQTRADGGQDQVMLERRGSKVDALTAALRLPDAPHTDGACDMMLRGVAWFAVLDAAGRWLRPGIAADACGQVRIEVQDAVNRLELRTVATTVLGEVKSAAAARSGCQQEWSDMVGAVTASGPTPMERPFEPPGRDMRLCLYTVPPSEQGSTKPGGRFEKGDTLSTQAWTDLRAAMLPAGPAQPCAAHASRFALFQPVDNLSGEVYVELDGCHRMLWSGPSGDALRQGTAALAEQISKAL